MVSAQGCFGIVYFFIKEKVNKPPRLWAGKTS